MIGEPGSGKTTLVNSSLRDEAAEEQDEDSSLSTFHRPQNSSNKQYTPQLLCDLLLWDPSGCSVEVVKLARLISRWPWILD